MPIQLCPIDIPDGWEFVECSPEITSCGSLGTEMVSACAIRLVRAWEWPEWLTADWLAMDSNGEWCAFMTKPSMLERCWDNEDGGIIQFMNSQTTAFSPPPCDDWKKSLRKNPRSK